MNDEMVDCETDMRWWLMMFDCETDMRWWLMMFDCETDMRWCLIFHLISSLTTISHFISIIGGVEEGEL